MINEAKLEETEDRLGTYSTKSFFVYAYSAPTAIKLLNLYPRKETLVHEINETIR